MLLDSTETVVFRINICIFEYLEAPLLYELVLAVYLATEKGNHRIIRPVEEWRDCWHNSTFRNGMHSGFQTHISEF